MKNSQRDQYYKSHVHDESFDEKIEALYDALKFRLIVGLYFYLDKNSLRHEIEILAIRAQNMKTH